MKAKCKFICAIAIAVVMFAGSGMVYPAAGGSVYAATEASKVKVSTPQKLKAVRAGNTSLKLSWQKSPDATGYTVYRYNPKTKKYKAVKTLEKDALSWTDKNLESDTVYSYKIRAFAKKDGRKFFSRYTYIVSAVPYTEASSDGNAKKIEVDQTSFFLGLKRVAKVREPSIIAATEKFPVNHELVWTSSDTSIVTVDQNGWLRAKKKVGTANVYIRAHNGITKTLKIKVGNYANPKSFSNLNKIKAYDKEVAIISKNKDTICRVASFLSQSKASITIERKGDRLKIDGSSKKIKPIKKDLRKLLNNGLSRIELSYGNVMFIINSMPFDEVRLNYTDENGPADIGDVKPAPCWFFYVAIID